MARIVNTDNFNGDCPDESFVLHGMNIDSATEIAEVLNRLFSGPTMPRYWKIVDDNYELQGGFEP